MAGNPRENVKGKGFWDGGDSAQGENGQTGGRPSGFPGRRSARHVGLHTDMDFPPELIAPEDDSNAGGTR